MSQSQSFISVLADYLIVVIAIGFLSYGAWHESTARNDCNNLIQEGHTVSRSYFGCKVLLRGQWVDSSVYYKTDWKYKYPSK